MFIKIQNIESPFLMTRIKLVICFNEHIDIKINNCLLMNSKSENG